MHSFEQPNLEQKLMALTETAKQGKEKIPFLYKGLEDDDLRVRSYAYKQLKMLGETSTELERGIPLKTRDRIYAVYQSQVRYNVEFYDIVDSIDALSQAQYHLYHTQEDSSGNVFEYLSDAPENNPPRHVSGIIAPSTNIYLCAYCVDQLTAQAKMEIAYTEAFVQLPCSINAIYPDRVKWEYIESNPHYRVITSSNFDPGDFNLQTWVETNKIVIEDDLKARLNARSEQFDYIYSCSVIESLYRQRRFDLLRDVWQHIGHKPLAFVHEYVIDRPCYLQIHNNK